MSQTSEAPFLRVQEVAPLLGISRRRVLQIIRAGRIPAVREGRAVLVPRQAWDEWLRRRAEEALGSLRVPSAAPACEGLSLDKG